MRDTIPTKTGNIKKESLEEDGIRLVLRTGYDFMKKNWLKLREEQEQRPKDMKITEMFQE